MNSQAPPGKYVEPGVRDAKLTVERLRAMLDRNDVVQALERMNRRSWSE
jgi:hypothetical protein